MYEVQFGYRCERRAAFETFDLALEFYRGFCAARSDSSDSSLDARIVNTDQHDGSEDGNYGGLTAEERERISNVD